MFPSHEWARHESVLRFLSGSLLVLLIDLGALYSWLGGRIAEAITLHLLAVVITLEWVQRRLRRNLDVRMQSLLLMTTAALGPLGVVISLISGVLCRFRKHAPMPFEDWFSHLFPEEVLSESAQVHERILCGLENASGAPQVEPFRAVLFYGTLQHKQIAIAKMTRYFSPAFAPLLRHALNDGDNAVRVQAATALTRIERDYMQRYLAMEKACKADPDNLQALHSLASFCEAYANSGIPDNLGEQSYLQKAIGYYEELAKRQPGPEIDLALGRLYGRTRKLEESCFYFERCLNAGPVSQKEVAATYLETLYRMGVFARMRELASRYGIPVSRHEELDTLPNPEASGPWTSLSLPQQPAAGAV